jgi:antitoxin ParD1/3/4
MNISLTGDLVKLVQRKVKSGLYNNASEVIRDAIRQMDTNAQLLNELKLDRLRHALEPGVKQAKAKIFADYSLEAIIKELDKETVAP